MRQQLTKQEHQKRALATAKLFEYIELNNGEYLGKILSYLVSPIGLSKHPFRMDDNEFLGYIEREIKKIEDGTDEE